MNHKLALSNKIFDIVSTASQELGLETYVIGGFVRDLLLNKDFKKDIDIVTIGSGIDLATRVAGLISKKTQVQIFKT